MSEALHGLTGPPRPAADERTSILVVAAAAAIGALLVLVVGLARPIDDFWLALASGRAIRAGADPFTALPLTFLPLRAGALNPQWGAQLMFAAGGAGTALALHAALVLGGLALTAAAMRRVASWPATVVSALVTLAVLAPHLEARPQSFSVLFLPLALFLLARVPRATWLPLAYGVLVAVWANTHGAFVTAQAAAVIFAMDAWLPGGGTSDRRRRFVLAATAVVSLLAPLANPAGVRLLSYAYGLAGNDVVRSLATEWQPTWVLTPFSAAFWLFTALVLALRVAGRARVPRPQLWVSVLLFALAVLAVRAIPWFLLAIAPILAADVEHWRARSTRVGLVLSGRPPSTSRVPMWLLAGLAVLVAFQFARPALEDPRLYGGMPTGTAAALQAELSEGERTPLLHEQRWGGFLAWRLGDDVATLVDGRLEVQTAETWNRYFDVMAGKAEAVAFFEEQGVRWALVGSSRTALQSTLTGRGWQEVDRDAASVLLRRP